MHSGIKNLEKEVAANQEALDHATAIREKQSAKFNAEEKDFVESVFALKAAIIMLSKHHGASAAKTGTVRARSKIYYVFPRAPWRSWELSSIFRFLCLS